jgi:hypothetical protein
MDCRLHGIRKRKERSVRLILLATIWLLLNGCGQPSQALAPTSAPAPLPTTFADAQRALVEQAQIALAAQPAVDAQTLQLQRIQAETWPTSALGCPDPEQLYTQALTPGFLIVFADATRTYDIHTTGEGGPLLWCNEGRPTSISAA